MKKITILLFIIFSVISIKAQRITISGNVYNKNTSEILIGANIFENNSKKGVTTNNFGFYSFTFSKKDSLNLTISNFGYNSIDTTIYLSSNRIINFYLNDRQIKAVVVQAQNRTEISTVEIPMANIKIMPSLTGEKDILKAYQLMPGIQSGKEGSSSLHVRGGSPDQNLILIDDVPVYYINHLGGFVSIFDENAINNFKIIKGGFPARYGGRLSSVVDVRLKDGNMQKFTGEISMGLIASKLSLQGPIIKNKTSFIISARRCNLDLITKPILYFTQDGATAGYTFYDLNFKIRHKINKNNSIYFTTYLGNDNITVNFKDDDETENIKSLMKNRWGNINNSFRWNHVYNSKLFSNYTVAFSKFYYETHEEYEKKEHFITTEDFLHSYKINIQDIITKIDYDYYLSPSNNIKFGAYYTYKNYNPGKEQYKIHIDSTVNYDIENINDQLFSSEFAIYAEDKISYKNRFFINIGVHASGYLIENDFFYSIQPRIIPQIKIYNELYFITSYTKMKQYIHLLTNNSTGMPYDLWMPATKIAKPEDAEQFSAGFSNLFKKINVFISIEGYYKKLDNLIEQNTTQLFLLQILKQNGKTVFSQMGKVKYTELSFLQKNLLESYQVGYLILGVKTIELLKKLITEVNILIPTIGNMIFRL